VRSGPAGSRLVRFVLDGDPQFKKVLKDSKTQQYLSVAANKGKVLYVRNDRCGQALELMNANGSNGRTLLKGKGPAGTDGCGRGATPITFWTVALSGKRAYMTELEHQANGRPTPSIVSVGL
jgi:hypothetical protein